MTAAYDVVIVGSGFGGSVTAARLAAAGWSVLVLERGRAYPPGSYPRSPRGLGANFWDPDADLYGMFDIWSFQKLDAVVSSGLGGGSLIYANVMLRKDDATFVQDGGATEAWEHWPVTGPQLTGHYEKVETMLGATPYPVQDEPYASTPKTLAFRAAAAAAGLRCDPPDLAISFAGADGRNVPRAPVGRPADNLHDMPRTTCTLCGACDLGCNAGAKNTLDFTYLSAAMRDGAHVRTCCEVNELRRLDDEAWEVGYEVHDAARRGHVTEPEDGPAKRTVRAHHVVLAAGTFGTARLLRFNLAALPGISPRLGERVSANGDLLTFAMDCRDADGDPRHLDPSTGPVITSTVRVPDARAPGGRAGAREHYVQDAGYPAFGEWLWHATLDLAEDVITARRTIARIVFERLRKVRDTNLSAEMSTMLGDADDSAAMLPLLGMGRDLPGGRITREGPHLQCSWAIDDSAAFYEELRETSRTLAEGMGGRLGKALIGEIERIVASHPLGGCAMGRSRDEGVVDDLGNVFGCRGLHVADGSVMPGPVGPNPSLTIAALADRFADGMIAAGRP